MKTLIRTTALLAALAIAATPAAPDDAAKKEAIRKDRKLYEGVWKVETLVVDGNKAEQADAEKITVVNDDKGAWIIKVEGKQISYGTSTFDPTKKPKTIDFIPSEGAGQGQTHLGIYEIDGDTRKLCFAGPGKERPKAFEAESGSENILVTFKRVKEK